MLNYGFVYLADRIWVQRAWKEGIWKWIARRGRTLKHWNFVQKWRRFETRSACVAYDLACRQVFQRSQPWFQIYVLQCNRSDQRNRLHGVCVGVHHNLRRSIKVKLQYQGILGFFELRWSPEKRRNWPKLPSFVCRLRCGYLSFSGRRSTSWKFNAYQDSRKYVASRFWLHPRKTPSQKGSLGPSNSNKSADDYGFRRVEFLGLRRICGKNNRRFLVCAQL